MKTLRCSSVALLVYMLIAACGNPKDVQKEELTSPKGTEREATFAAGCFWGIQEAFLQIKGVSKATSGYSGGFKENPTYEEVSSETTGHAEAVQVVYDPNVVSFAKLVEAFMHMHDPTQLNRQGPDVGASYRSIAFYRDASEKSAIEDAIVKYNRTKFIQKPIVTEVLAFEKFYSAEKYHQNYYRTNPANPYIQNVCGPKLEKFRKAMPELLKDEFK